MNNHHRHHHYYHNNDDYDNHKQPKKTTPTMLVELGPEEQEEVSWKEIASVLSTSIKKDEAPKLITFCAMLLAQTNEDQLNLGFQAKSSSGKSYVPLGVSVYFPEQEIEIIASASPAAFYHDGGKWDDVQKAVIKDLAHKNLIFLDMPHFQLLEKLRPVLSHDRKELHYMIIDKSAHQTTQKGSQEKAQSSCHHSYRRSLIAPAAVVVSLDSSSVFAVIL